MVNPFGTPSDERALQPPNNLEPAETDISASWLAPLALGLERPRVPSTRPAVSDSWSHIEGRQRLRPAYRPSPGGSSFDQAHRPSHGPRFDHQYDRGCEHQTQQTE